MTWICSQCGEKFSRFRTRCSSDGQRVIEDLAGQLIGGRYRIRELVGIGGMDSTVWKAWQTGTERVVAVKVLPAAEEAAAKRFARGARIAANLNHPNCTVVHDYGRTDDGKLFLVMEFLHGQVLQEVLGPEGMSANDTIHVADQVLQALEHAHGQRAVHRDLKPDNLFLSRKNDDPLHVKILDFGIAKYVEEDPENTSTGEESSSEGFEDLVTEQRQVCGTPQYMAPEQVVGARIDGRTDLYALGVVMYRMLTGRLPFDGKTRYELYQKHLQEAPRPFHEVRPDLSFPERLELIVMKALSKRPDQRFQSAADMRKAIVSVELTDDRQRRGVRPRVSLKHTSPQGPSSPTMLPNGHWTLGAGSPAAESTAEPLVEVSAGAYDATIMSIPRAPEGRASDVPPPLPPSLLRNRPSSPDAELVLPTDLPLPHASPSHASSSHASPSHAAAPLPHASPSPSHASPPVPPLPPAPRTADGRPPSAGLKAAVSLEAPTDKVPQPSLAPPARATNILSDAVVRHPAGRSSLAVAPEVPRSTETEPNRAREAGEKRRRRLGVIAVLAGAFLLGVGGVALVLQLVGDDDGGEVAATQVEGGSLGPAGVAPAAGEVARPEAPRAGVTAPSSPSADPARSSPAELERPAEATLTAGTVAGETLAVAPVAPAAPAKVAVKLESEPAGALVSEGLTILGPTPLDIAVEPGRHVYTLSREGFVNAIVEIDAAAGAPVARKLVLAPDRPTITPPAPGGPGGPVGPGGQRRAPPPNNLSNPNKVLGELTQPPGTGDIKPEPPPVKEEKPPEPPKAPQVKLLDDKPAGTPGDPSKKPTIKLLGEDEGEAPKKPKVKVLEE